MDTATRIKQLEAVVESLAKALSHAPHKHRIDFQPYWDWYDGHRALALKEATDTVKTLPK